MDRNPVSITLSGAEASGQDYFILQLMPLHRSRHPVHDFLRSLQKTGRSDTYLDKNHHCNLARTVFSKKLSTSHGSTVNRSSSTVTQIPLQDPFHGSDTAIVQQSALIPSHGTRYLCKPLLSNFFSLFIVHNIDPAEQKALLLFVLFYRLGSGNDRHPFLNILFCRIAFFAKKVEITLRAFQITA